LLDERKRELDEQLRTAQRNQDQQTTKIQQDLQKVSLELTKVEKEADGAEAELVDLRK